MYISDKHMEVCFKDIEDSVDAIKGHQQDLKADEIKACLRQVSRSQFIKGILPDFI